MLSKDRNIAVFLLYTPKRTLSDLLLCAQGEFRVIPSILDPCLPECPVASLWSCECVYRCASQSFYFNLTPAFVFACVVGAHSTHPVHSLPPPWAQRERPATAHPLQPHQETWRWAEVGVWLCGCRVEFSLRECCPALLIGALILLLIHIGEMIDWTTAICKSCYRFSIRMRWVLWEGHRNTFSLQGILKVL